VQPRAAHIQIIMPIVVEQAGANQIYQQADGSHECRRHAAN